MSKLVKGNIDKFGSKRNQTHCSCLSFSISLAQLYALCPTWITCKLTRISPTRKAIYLAQDFPQPVADPITAQAPTNRWASCTIISEHHLVFKLWTSSKCFVFNEGWKLETGFRSQKGLGRRWWNWVVIKFQEFSCLLKIWMGEKFSFLMIWVYFFNIVSRTVTVLDLLSGYA